MHRLRRGNIFLMLFSNFCNKKVLCLSVHVLIRLNKMASQNTKIGIYLILHIRCFLLPLSLPNYELEFSPQLSFSSIVFLLWFLGLILPIFVSFMHILITLIFIYLVVYALFIFHLLNESNLVPN